MAVTQPVGTWEPEGCQLKSNMDHSMELRLVAVEVQVHLLGTAEQGT